MKNHLRSSIVLFISILYGLFLAVGFATAADQFKPDSINAFFCSWQGSLTVNDVTLGADVKITPTEDPAYATANIQTYGTIDFGRIITVKPVFADGEMSTQVLTFTLLEPNKLQIRNKRTSGVFTLRCSR
ncbi:MAG: hypothetical protein Q8Q10_02855 [bacterium]|nr:hypothetical protein [bacterium]